MATSITGADRLPDADYSVSHRAPPPVPSLPPSAGSHAPYQREQQQQQQQCRQQQQQYYLYSRQQQPFQPPPQPAPPRQQSPHPNALSTQSPRAHADAVSVSTSEHKRKGSFSSFLRRSSSNPPPGPASQQSKADHVPPLPVTRIAQVAQAYAQAESTLDRASLNNTRKSSAEGAGASGRMMIRKSSKVRAEQERQAREAERLAALNRPPPRLPQHNPLPGIDTFGGDDASPPTPVPSYRPANFSRPGTVSAMNHSSSSPAYAVRSGPADGRVKSNGEYVGSPMQRAESMANRGRYSYASSSMAPVNVNSPRRVRRRKDPTPFNVLVIGAKNSGKTSFISFLRHSFALPAAHKAAPVQLDAPHYTSKSSFTSHYLESDMEGERVGLTLWDSVGLQKNIVDLQLREMSAFVESKFEETFVEEQKVMRSPGIKDTHIHCVFLVLDPVRLDGNIAASATLQVEGGMPNKFTGLDDDFDLQVLRALWGKTTVIPVVSKADTLTVAHMSFLKRTVWQSIKNAKLDPLEALELEDDMGSEEDESDDSEINGNSSAADDSIDGSDFDMPLPKAKKSHHRQSSLTTNSIRVTDDEMPYIPMSILSPDMYELPPYTSNSKVHTSEKVGRRFPWGFADPCNPEHCDFTRLRDSIFTEWRGELRELSRTKWYENWRTSRLKNLPGSKQRVKGGVTPVAAVPREGRMSPSANRSMSAHHNGASMVPRTVSGGSMVLDNGPANTENMIGVAQAHGY